LDFTSNDNGLNNSACIEFSKFSQLRCVIMV
jgi:hypothetical protein